MSKVFEIRVTDTEDDNDIATYEVERSDEDSSAQEVLDIMTAALKEDLEFQYGDRYVVISDASDGEGYMYDLYASKKAYEDGEDSEDGGQCTGSLSNALEMALS